MGGSPPALGAVAILRRKMPPKKARASDQELAQDGRGVGPQILEMRHQHGAKIEHFFPAHHLRADVQFAHHGLPSDIVLIVKPGLSKNRAGEGDERSQRDRRMIHEAASDHVVLVAESAGLQSVLKQQNAGVFQAAGSEHKGLGPDLELPSIRRASLRRGDGPRQGIHLQLEQHGAQNNGYPLITDEFSAIMLQKNPRGAKLGDDRLDFFRLPGLAVFRPGFPSLSSIVEFSDAADLLGVLVERLDLPAAERPAAFRYPVAALEVDFIQRQVANVPGGFTAHLVIPEIGGAAKLPTASLPQGLLAIAVS